MPDLAEHGGRLVPNRGSMGDSAPSSQALAAPGVALDEDGNYSHERIVWDPEVVDPLGNREAITLTFAAYTDRQGFISRTDHPELPETDLIVSVWVRAKGDGAGSFVLGSTADTVGPKTVFTTSPDWTEVSVEVPAYSPEAKFDLVLRPAPETTLPTELSIFSPTVRESGSGEATALDQDRKSRRAGHALAPLALPGAAKADPQGGFISTGRTVNLIAELDPVPVSSHAMSGWIRVDQLPRARGFLMAFSRTENPSEKAAEWGKIGIQGESAAEDFRGRLIYASGGNLDRQLYSPHFDGSGWLHVHINYGHAGSDAPISEGKVAHELLINGIPFHERNADPIGGVVPRILSLGSTDGSAKSTQRGDGVLGNPFELVRYEPNTRIPRDEVLARVKRDREEFPNLREPLAAMILVEGDSTSQQRGSPVFMYARELRKPGRLFVNHARGGSWYQEGKESNTDYIGTGQRRAMRLEAMRNALDLGYSKVFTLWTPGENDYNGRGILRPDGDPNEAVHTLTDFILEDLKSVEPGRTRTRSIFVSMKMSNYSDKMRDSTQSRVRAYWAALDAIYSEPVDPVNAPYLFRAPADHPEKTHDYFIAMHKWAPTNGKHTWKDWGELAADAVADRNGARDIISGDGQHWSQGWNPHVSRAVHIPSLQKIFELEGVE